ncbi:OmpP1/FadL family transporter [Reinekea thalattae]|uniref:Transporter n=1 Tax=Reinekea thalattae TaxID=2593301 RepID=A0A5C8Z7E1_9GAMM|nr:outer membrane protein transport protein [Reinekea thalattae]TXR53557.1 transporter [Reinekea thalattae]
MNFKKHHLALIVAASITSPISLAAGFQVTNHSASGLGHANAGDAVIADNASAIANNPAAIMLFDSASLSVGANGVVPSTDVTDVKLNGALELDDAEDVTNSSTVPYLYYIHPVNEQFSVGASIYSDFGTSVEYSDEFNDQYYLSPAINAGLYAGTTKIWSLNYAATAGYRINDAISLGGSVKALNGGGTFERGTTIDFEGSGWTYGWDLGVVYELSPQHRFGLSYKSAMDLDVQDTTDSTFTSNGYTFGIDYLEISLPSIAEFSGYHGVTENLAVHYSIMHIGWSGFEELNFKLDSEVLPEYTSTYGWDDSWRYSLGTTYQASTALALRAGISYDESPIPEDKRIFSIVDSNRIWYSTGATWAFNEQSSIDFGLSYIVGEEVDIEEAIYIDALGSDVTLSGTAKTTAWLAGLQFNYNF